MFTWCIRLGSTGCLYGVCCMYKSGNMWTLTLCASPALSAGAIGDAMLPVAMTILRGVKSSPPMKQLLCNYMYISLELVMLMVV